MRIEDRLEEDRYVVQAELPGVDPDKDVHIDVQNNQLMVSAERREETTEKGRSEFRYGSFRRRVSLPPGPRRTPSRHGTRTASSRSPVRSRQSKPSLEAFPSPRAARPLVRASRPRIPAASRVGLTRPAVPASHQLPAPRSPDSPVVVTRGRRRCHPSLRPSPR